MSTVQLNYASERFDFSPIEQTIAHFYPIGVNKETDPSFFEHPGIKELEKIVVSCIHNQDHLYQEWQKFEQHLHHTIQKELIGTTYGQAPSLSSKIILENSELNNLTRTKELHICLSLTGHYYTVIGQDLVAIQADAQTQYQRSVYLIVSPENDFAVAFEKACDEIEESFKGYRFVPFQVYHQPIEGLSLRYTDQTNGTVFNALFNDLIDISNKNVIGKHLYKSENWVRAGYESRGEWQAYRP